MTLPANLPNVANARLPDTYEAAAKAIAECARIDECADWANKAEAMAAYARMSEDDSLRRRCDRIQARAIRRCGELLREYDGRSDNARKQTDGTDSLITRRRAAEDAGMSERQQTTAARVANVPEDDFNAQVEGDDPPTVTALAEQGKKTRPLVDLQGRDPEEFSVSTYAQGDLRDFAKLAETSDTGAIVRGALPHETAPMLEHVAAIIPWLERLRAELEQ